MFLLEIENRGSVIHYRESIRRIEQTLALKRFIGSTFQVEEILGDLIEEKKKLSDLIQKLTEEFEKQNNNPINT